MPYWVIAFKSNGRGYFVGQPTSTESLAEMKYGKMADSKGDRYKVYQTRSWNKKEAAKEIRFGRYEESDDNMDTVGKNFSHQYESSSTENDYRKQLQQHRKSIGAR